MKNKLLSALMLGSLCLAACGGDDEGTTNEPTTPAFTTAQAINTYLEGKTYLMEGANIPSHPNGYDENKNLGSYSQCYNKVTMVITGGPTYAVTSDLGTFRTEGSTTICDNTTKSGNAAPFTTTNVLVENVAADGSCFDVTYTYNGFGQEGRGKLSKDGKTMTLELFFAGQATGHRCVNGAVGSKTVTLNGAAFTGNAQQVYVQQ
ncbi:hypothetical protein FGE12_14375 [Aggregicoccus sp. 17bor-14]|uniref:hypothetical protein n=1 Tax=Myxococcaceae TaxID=31 RepID=UPI00129C2AF3|nr:MULTISPECIES: hypothetical protein [Myxococcaceae]MBF5043579.1 hypothetical protein [Simulacricoccus sp. 17bor-14]MRI89338.1 hypothetical protein [Aggregicoccus sp. 17bor-14]